MQVWVGATKSHLLPDHPDLGPGHTPSDAGPEQLHTRLQHRCLAEIHSVGLSMDPVNHQKTEKPRRERGKPKKADMLERECPRSAARAIALQTSSNFQKEREEEEWATKI